MFGFIKPKVDAHTLGISTISNFLKICGYNVHLLQSLDLQEISEWIKQNEITAIGFSYRLDTKDAYEYFCNLHFKVKGIVDKIYFAGLPEACELVQKKFKDDVIVFSGGEEPVETLIRLGISADNLPASILQNNDYDNARFNFAEKLIKSKEYQNILPKMSVGDSYLSRLEFCTKNKSLPIIRAHAGPYGSNREEAINEFCEWAKQLSNAKYLDVLSIGSSQLTQECFGENWDGKANGGGVPVNSEEEYAKIKKCADTMLVRTYAGVKNIQKLAKIHEDNLDISWHALSFWWFCEIDGRGKNSVLDNLKEHFETIKYIATTEKPLEPNVPHHFAFRGSDDASCVIAGFLANKVSKILGIKHLIIQCMQNNPKHTWGVQDIAKARVLLKLTKELEDDNFSVSLQTRVGLDYLSCDIEKAKIQLASVSALMDDIEPQNENSPEIIHVVSYSEANNLANPEIINDSIKITLCALQKYRQAKITGIIDFNKYEDEIEVREKELYHEAKEAILFLEENIENLYTPEGFFYIFEKGIFPLPYLLDEQNKFPDVKKYSTMLENGGVYCVDEKGNKIKTIDRYRNIIIQSSHSDKTDWGDIFLSSRRRRSYERDYSYFGERGNKISLKPLVSINCLTYNHAPYIRQCLDGFVMQKTDFPIEVLIHDDASTDETADIIREYEQKYPDIIKPIYQKENQYSKGILISKTYNYPRAQGKYIAICEGDDYWTDPLKLQKQVDFLENNPEYGMCYTKVRVYSQKLKKILKGTWGKEFGLSDALRYANDVPTLTICLRKELLFKYYDEIKPETRDWKMGDLPLVIWFTCNSRIYFIDEFTGVYRVLQNSASHQASYENNIKFAESARKIVLFYAEHYKIPFSEKFLNDGYFKRCALYSLEFKKYVEYNKFIAMIGHNSLKTILKKLIGKSKILMNMYYYLVFRVRGG